jgi:hypothetical protein
VSPSPEALHEATRDGLPLARGDPPGGAGDRIHLEQLPQVVQVVVLVGVQPAQRRARLGLTHQEAFGLQPPRNHLDTGMTDPQLGGELAARQLLRGAQTALQ